jgi:hypothetical protein
MRQVKLVRVEGEQLTENLLHVATDSVKIVVARYGENATDEDIRLAHRIMVEALKQSEAGTVGCVVGPNVTVEVWEEEEERTGT